MADALDKRALFAALVNCSGWVVWVAAAPAIIERTGQWRCWTAPVAATVVVWAIVVGIHSPLSPRRAAGSLGLALLAGAVSAPLCFLAVLVFVFAAFPPLFLVAFPCELVVLGGALFLEYELFHYALGLIVIEERREV